jgi:hypothetical protein
MKVVFDRKLSQAEGLQRIVNIATFAIVLATAVIALLLGILLDLAPRTRLTAGREYEAIRLFVELLAFLGTAGFTLWNLLNPKNTPDS